MRPVRPLQGSQGPAPAQLADRVLLTDSAVEVFAIACSRKGISPV